MFRHIWVASWLSLIDANYIGDDPPIITLQEHKRVRLATAGEPAQHTCDQAVWFESSGVVRPERP